jgi:DNA helicase HerA-like ATPase
MTSTPDPRLKGLNVVNVTPNLIQVEVTNEKDIRKYNIGIGTYLELESTVIVCVVSYKIKDPVPENDSTPSQKKFLLDTQPIGCVEGGKFVRGVRNITIPPCVTSIVEPERLKDFYALKKEEKKKELTLGNLSSNLEVSIPIDGDKFFSKHIAVLGSTGSGKSWTVAKIIEEAKKTEKAFNNTHILLFDIHGEYSSAFSDANKLDVDTIKLPYWLMSGEELIELFVESNEENSYNQISQFTNAVVQNKIKHNKSFDKKDVKLDTPLYFSLEEVFNYISNLNKETVPNEFSPESTGSLCCYFNDILTFPETKRASTGTIGITQGDFYGKFSRFVRRLEVTKNDPRLTFLINPTKSDRNPYKTDDLTELYEQFTGYSTGNSKNITILDLSGVPFEETSIIVSLISRLLFQLAFNYKKKKGEDDQDNPFLLVYEEAHRYVPNSSLSKYSSVKTSIERIAKEGRKYGIALMIVSQRPSEISETIFSQCNNFVAMRLTNPSDQNYIKKLLPDTLNHLMERLPILEQGEAIIVGDAITIPSSVKIGEPTNKPNSHDVDFYTEWQKNWFDWNLEDLVRKAPSPTK